MKIKFALILAFVLIANAAFFVYFGYLRRPSGQHFAYGEAFPAQSAVDLKGRSVEWKNQWALLINTTLEYEPGVRNARYADVLFRRFAASGLAVVGIVRAARSEVEKFAESNGISYPVVPDSDGRFAQRLSLSEHSFGVFLVNPSGKIEFTATQAEPDDLRQLTEKYINGSISYVRGGAKDVLKLGERIPPIQVQDLKQSRQVNVSLSNEGVMVIFTARCPSCGLNEYLKLYRAFEIQRNKKGQDPLVIFSSRFSAREISEMAADLGVDARLYLANDAIPGVEDEYYSGSYGTDEALVITTDNTGTVTSIEPLAANLRKARGGTAQ